MVMHSNGHIGWVLRGKVHTGRARWDLRCSPCGACRCAPSHHFVMPTSVDITCGSPAISRGWLGLPKQTAKSAVTARRLLLSPLRLFGRSREQKRAPAHTGECWTKESCAWKCCFAYRRWLQVAPVNGNGPGRTRESVERRCWAHTSSVRTGLSCTNTASSAHVRVLDERVVCAEKRFCIQERASGCSREQKRPLVHTRSIRRREMGAEEGAGAHGKVTSDEDAERNGG